MKREYYLIFIILGVLIFAFFFNSDNQNDLSQKSESYLVTKVFDGDTIGIRIDGGQEIIRLLGFDTPEVKGPYTEEECYGVESSKKMRELLLNKYVRLENDSVKENRDQYNRLLRYVFLENNINVGELLIREGYAREMTFRGEPYKYQKLFNEAETEARNLKRGLWGSC